VAVGKWAEVVRVAGKPWLEIRNIERVAVVL
jgi:hypothetical protein